MTAADAVSYAAVGSNALPWLAALVRRGRLPAELLALAIFSVLGTLESTSMAYLTNRGVRNLWMIHWFTPIEGSVFLWVLGRWQARELARMTVFLAIPLFVAGWAVLTVEAESLRAFPTYTSTLEGLLITVVAAYTLVTRSRTIAAPITRYDWFWVSSGLLLYFSYSTLLGVVSNGLLGYSRDLVLWAFTVNALLAVVMNVAIARAVLLGRARPGPAAPGSARTR